MSTLVLNWPDIDLVVFKTYVQKLQQAFLKVIDPAFVSTATECLDFTTTAFAVLESVYTTDLQLETIPSCIFTGVDNLDLVHRIKFQLFSPNGMGTSHYSKTFNCAAPFVYVIQCLLFLYALPKYLDHIPNPHSSNYLQLQVINALRFLKCFIKLQKKTLR